MARIGGFCIDRYEAYLVEDDADGNTVVHPPFERPRKGIRYRARNSAGVLPQAYLNRHEARAACENAGKRLCRLAEWYRACSGTKGTTYPYGPEEQAGYCNTGKVHLLAKLYGADPQRWSYEDHFNSPRLNQVPGFLARTGAHPHCVSEGQVFDLVGNLHEWISDRVDFELPKKIQLRNDIHAKVDDNYGKAIFMGGFYSTTDQHGPGCRFVTIGHGPAYHDYSTGFRCCADANGRAAPDAAPSVTAPD